MSDSSRHFRQRQGRATRWLWGGIVLLTTVLMSRHLADGNSPAFHFHPLVQPNTLAPTSTSSAETDPDPRAIELAQRLRQHLGDLQTTTQHQTTARLTRKQSHALSQLRARNQDNDNISIWLHPTAGTPRQIKGKVLQHARQSSILGKDAHEATARTFLQTNRALLRLDDPPAELALTRQQTDDLGRTQLRFDQTYRGLPVWPAELIVHLDPNGHVDLLNGVFVPTPKKLDTTPALDKATAIEYARTGLTDGDEAEVTASELIIYAPGDTPPRLAWKLELNISLTSHWLVVIDALNGDELTAWNQVMHQRVSGSGVDLFGVRRPLNVWQYEGRYWMIDTSKPMYNPSTGHGFIWIYDALNRLIDKPLYTSASSSPTSGWLPDGVSAAYNFSEVYDYYRERHNRNSLDNQGASIRAIVRLGRNFRNAFYNSGLNIMVFGDGDKYAGALDVVGHELTHGVITYSANLVYRNQPGALNEAFADIFGEMIQARTTGREPDWIVGTGLGRPLRNMANPAALTYRPGRPYPTKMSEFENLPPDKDNDNGGVHINSGIINRAYYLLAAGLNGAIGLRAAERIFYRALTVYLTQNSQFIDARLACIQAAEDLFGAGSTQARKTAEAFDAVEIGAAPPTPDPPDIPAVQGPDASLFVYRDQSGQFRMGRLENARGDKVPGVRLANAVVAAARPSVSRNGELAVFVNAQNDVCLIGTDGRGESCAGLPGRIASVAMSPDSRLFGFVFRDAQGNKENRIGVINLATNTTQTFTLKAPAYDGPATDTILYADAMDFTNNGQWLIYDALNAVTVAGGSQLRQWSLYALHLATGTSFPLTTPIPGLNVAWPALSQTSDNFLTFDAFDQARNQSTVYAVNLNAGELKRVATVTGSYGVPGYTGDDKAIVYTQRDSSVPLGFSLVRQPLAADRITPQGRPAWWLRNADYGVIYRRAGTPNPLAFALENPSPGQSQSGIGLLSGWVCEAEVVEFVITTARGTVHRFVAASGTSRPDTASVCGDTNNGFGVLFNWNRLGDGTHTVQLVVDGREILSRPVTVVTLGGEFLRGASGRYTVADFPQPGQQVILRWDESLQSFRFVPPGALPTGPIISGSPMSSLENPAPNSGQSGIGLVSGWVCEAETVEVVVTTADGTVWRLPAAYGTSRPDTAAVCGDTDNGFGVLFNWNRLGAGTHTARLWVNGVAEGSQVFTVTTLGEEFVRGLSGQGRLENFPTPGQTVTIEWQEAVQNFGITGVE